MSKVFEATQKQLLDYTNILTNERGDELWRFADGEDGRPRWKVWAVESSHAAAIRGWESTERGATYYDSKRKGKNGPISLGYDYIIPRKYLMRSAKLLGLKISKVKKQLTKEQIEHLQKIGFRKRIADKQSQQERLIN